MRAWHFRPTPTFIWIRFCAPLKLCAGAPAWHLKISFVSRKTFLMALCCSRLPLGVSACACVCPIFHLAGGGLSPCTVRMRRGLGNPVSHDLASNKERSPPGAARRLPPLPKASERVGSAGSSECFKPQFWPAAGCPFEGHEGLLLQIGGGWLLFRVSVGRSSSSSFRSRSGFCGRGFQRREKKKQRLCLEMRPLIF